MIADIYADPAMQGLIGLALAEEGIEVEIGSSLITHNDELDTDCVVILKPDLYYSPKNFARPPKSVDGVVITAGDEGEYSFYVIELKSSAFNNIKKADIQEKFNTIFLQFFSPDFSHIFDDLEYEVKNLNLWLVCDPLKLRLKSSTHEEFIEKATRFSSRIKGMMNDFASSLRPISFKNHHALITPLLSPPVIEKTGFKDLLNP